VADLIEEVDDDASVVSGKSLVVVASKNVLGGRKNHFTLLKSVAFLVLGKEASIRYRTS